MVANVRIILGVFGLVCALGTQTRYDLLLKGGHVIDPKNRIDRVMDVAVSNGKIARVAENIPASAAAKTIDVARLYVTPGLIDLHAHLLIRPHGPTEGVQPDAFSFRSGVTTMVDAGSTGWREFPEFRDTVIKRAKTRVLALLNIAGAGMLTGKEDDPAELDAEAAARMARGSSALPISAPGPSPAADRARPTLEAKMVKRPRQEEKQIGAAGCRSGGK